MKKTIGIFAGIFALTVGSVFARDLRVVEPEPSVNTSRSARNLPVRNTASSRGGAQPARTTTSRSARTLPARQAVTGASGDAMIWRIGSGGTRGSTVTRSARAAAPAVSRSGISPLIAPAGVARSATASVSRAGVSRATAVFNDVSKLGGGYAQCRESYNTCMDQFCANANETFRRCYCSDKFEQFQATEANLETAKSLLMQFQDNNLMAVDLTAAEVGAMYSATVGEEAIRKDPSGAQQILDKIGDILSGKTVVSAENNRINMTMEFDLGFDVEDIWSGGGADDIFSNNRGSNLTALSGVKLYNETARQCMGLSKDTCESDATFNMVRSAYSILIGQDCNAYEKKINATKEAVAKTVREAEQILREARLEDYRAHNTQDVNECLDRVRDAMLEPVACGPNFVKCLDYTGEYIDSQGEVNYTPKLFDLRNLLRLEGAYGNVAQMNPGFDRFIEDKKMHAAQALDTCRDKSDLVWGEFKRAALIEIAQAQDDKIEEVQDDCLNIVRECYDQQSGGLAKMGGEQTGALNVATARAMCADKLMACANLYTPAGGTACTFDNRTGAITNRDSCGLRELIDFVDTSDDIKIAEGCRESMENYAKEFCKPAPSEADKGPFWGCRLRTEAEIKTAMDNQAAIVCKNPRTGDIDAMAQQYKDVLLSEVTEELNINLRDLCESVTGVWFSGAAPSGTAFEQAFYTEMSGSAAGSSTDIGYCAQNTERAQCLAAEDASGSQGWISWNETNNACEFSAQWREFMCEQIGGYIEGNDCYTLE